MFQEFFTDTLMSRFIKRLIRSTNLPLLHILEDGDKPIHEASYLYKNEIRRYSSNTEYIAYPYDPTDITTHYNFHSKHMYYDTETHKQLGEYLRYIKATKGLNLMPYYNCLSYMALPNLTLKKPESSDSPHYTTLSDPTLKVYAAAIKFGKEYTIAIDSDTPVKIAPVIYHEDFGLISTDATRSNYYTDQLSAAYMEIPNSRFTEPFIFSMPPTEDLPLDLSLSLYAQEKNLYLAIQTDVTNDSSVVILEGDYTNSWKEISITSTLNSGEIEDLESSNKNKITKSEQPASRGYLNLSLLQFNSKKSFAFSSRLFEYLLLNIIHKDEEISGNIEYLDNILRDLPKDLFNISSEYTSKGNSPYLWSDDMQQSVRKYINNLQLNEIAYFRDQDGNFNSDIEEFILKENAV